MKKLLVSRKLFILTILLTLVGCAATPSVRYQKLNEADSDGLIKFHLAKSLIVISENAASKQLEAKSIPAEAQETTYAIVPNDRVGTRTHLNVTYIDNTRLISSIGSEVEDNRVKLITSIGKVVTGLVTLEVPPTPPNKPVMLPVVIDVQDYEDANVGGQDWFPLPRNDGWLYRLTIENAPVDVVATNVFFGTHANRNTDSYPYSSCSDAKLELKPKVETGPIHIFSLKVARPNSIHTLKLPAKGKIDMHTACGANVTNEKTEASSTWALIAESIKQAKALKDVQKNEGE